MLLVGIVFEGLTIILLFSIFHLIIFDLNYSLSPLQLANDEGILPSIKPLLFSIIVQRLSFDMRIMPTVVR